MSEENERPNWITQITIGGIVAISVIIVAMSWWNNYLFKRFGDDLRSRAEFSSQFGAVEVVIAGVTFFGLALSIVFQSRDLRAQTRALKLQQEALQLQITEFKEQKEELRRSAEAQEQVAKAQEKANRIAVSQLAFDRAKLRIQSSIAFAENSTNGAQRKRMLEVARSQALALEKNFPGDQFDEGTAT